MHHYLIDKEKLDQLLLGKRLIETRFSVRDGSGVSVSRYPRLIELIFEGGLILTVEAEAGPGGYFPSDLEVSLDEPNVAAKQKGED